MNDPSASDRTVVMAADVPTGHSGAPEPEPHARAFVWLAFALMFALVLSSMIELAPRLPMFDDYEMVPSYAGERPLTVDWLWSLSNEHRVFLPRLIHVVNFRLSGGDFRASNLLSLASLAVAAGSLIEAARRRRGHQRYADAFFPLVLLNPSQLENLTWAWELVHVVPCAVACLLLGFIATRADWPTAAGGGRLRPRPVPAPADLGHGADPGPRPDGLADPRGGAVAVRREAPGALLVALTVPTIALIGLYFKGYARPNYLPARGTRFEMGRTFAEFLTIGLGPAVKPSWRPTFAVISGLVGLGGLMAAWSALKRPSERPRRSGSWPPWPPSARWPSRSESTARGSARGPG